MTQEGLRKKLGKRRSPLKGSLGTEGEEGQGWTAILPLEGSKRRSDKKKTNLEVSSGEERNKRTYVLSRGKKKR